MQEGRNSASEFGVEHSLRRLSVHFKPEQAHPPLTLGAQLGLVLGVQVGSPATQPTRGSAAAGAKFRVLLQTVPLRLCARF